MRRVARSPIFWFVLVVIVATALNLWAQNRSEDHAADTIYRNQVVACVQENPLREAVAIAIGHAAATAEPDAARHTYKAAYNHMLEQPFINADGSKQCYRAIKHP